MSLCTVRFRGESIGKQAEMLVIVPESRRGPFPVLYLLHGLSDDCTIWLRRTRIEWYARDLPLIVVMPDGAKSYYVNSEAGGAYEDHIVKDVAGFVDRTFPTLRKRSGRAVAGLSMGGYGALMLGMKHPGLFCAAASHSGALGLSRGLQINPAVKPLLPALRKKEYDCRALASELKTARRRPAIRIDCGAEDPLLRPNRKFHAYLKKIGLSHVYEEHPGGHDWNYWDLRVQDTLRFVMEKLARR